MTFILQFKFQEEMNLKPASHRFFQGWSAFNRSQIYSRVGGPFNSFNNVRHSSLESLSENDLTKNSRSIFRALLAGERWALARAITLIESTNKVSVLFVGVHKGQYRVKFFSRKRAKAI